MHPTAVGRGGFRGEWAITVSEFGSKTVDPEPSPVASGSLTGAVLEAESYQPARESGEAQAVR